MVLRAEPDFEPIVLPFNYSAHFREDLILVSWRDLADFYVVIPLDFSSLLYRR